MINVARLLNRRQNRPDWFAAAVGIMTTATILVGATVAAYITVALAVRGAVDFEDFRWLVQIAVASTIASVVFYGFTLVFALATFNRPTEALRATEIGRATSTLFLQAFSAVIFVLIVIIGSLWVDSEQPDQPEHIVVRQTSDAATILNDARNLQVLAVIRLEQGQIREAAELAWGATKRATDSLILAETGVIPITMIQTSNGLDALASKDRRIRSLLGHYHIRVNQLHSACFYDGICNAETERRIRETEEFISHVEDLTDE